jgi:hypothetical protein
MHASRGNGVANSKRPRIFWHELAAKWAIRTQPLADAAREKMFTAALRQTCAAVFHRGAQVWLVPADHMEKAKQLVTKYYRYYEFIDRIERQEGPPPVAPGPVNDAYKTFCLLVGWELGTHLTRSQARALYRQAAARLHPDIGGSADKMAALNAAWRAIRDDLPS